MGKLAGKVAVVLGASSEGGTGWKIAELLAEEGAELFVGARTLASVEKLATQIGGKAFRCDATNEDTVKAFADFAAAGKGHIDLAVNAAGCPFPGTIETLDLKTLQMNIETNFYGQLFFVRQMAARMLPGGSITAILSAAATRVCVGADGYTFAKAAAMHMVRYAAIEYAQRGIRINAINPGLIDTPLVASVVNNPAVLETFLKETPLRRIASPTDIAKTALWLADAEMITGAGIDVDGGMHLGRFPLPWEMPEATYDKL